MDTDTIRAVAPHYIAMLVLVYAVVFALRTLVQIGFWAEIVVIAALVFGYRYAVVRLGMAPEAWQPEA